MQGVRWLPVVGEAPIMLLTSPETVSTYIGSGSTKLNKFFILSPEIACANYLHVYFIDCHILVIALSHEFVLYTFCIF